VAGSCYFFDFLAGAFAAGFFAAGFAVFAREAAVFTAGLVAGFLAAAVGAFLAGAWAGACACDDGACEE
jgi:hypothetical protein